MDFRSKYLKYKNKYLHLKQHLQTGGGFIELWAELNKNMTDAHLTALGVTTNTIDGVIVAFQKLAKGEVATGK